MIFLNEGGFMAHGPGLMVKADGQGFQLRRDTRSNLVEPGYPGWAWVPKTESNRAKIRQNICLLFWLFLVLFNVVYRYFGLYIIPKWLINDSWSIARLFKWFRELRNFVKNWTRKPSNYYQHSSKNTRKYGNILDKSYLSYLSIWILDFCRKRKPSALFPFL